AVTTTSSSVAAEQGIAKKIAASTSFGRTARGAFIRGIIGHRKRRPPASVLPSPRLDERSNTLFFGLLLLFSGGAPQWCRSGGRYGAARPSAHRTRAFRRRRSRTRARRCPTGTRGTAHSGGCDRRHEHGRRRRRTVRIGQDAGGDRHA